MNKKWQIQRVDEEKISKICDKFNINTMLAGILVNRGVINEEQVRIFLNPTRNDFYDPFLMPDMNIAIDRILKAINTQEKVIIYGDYDVDGITSVTVLKSFLKECGLDVDEYIPNRLEEGYGLNKAAVEQIARDGYKLIITVDCGISAVEEVKFAKELGMEVIITDHHEPGEMLPSAIAVVDAKRKDNMYPCRNLAGVGVVFKVIQAITLKLNLEEKTYLKYLDIVCVGTISDIVPLTDENRVIVKLGLLLVKQTQNLGLKKIIMASGYSKIDSVAISFGVAPRINACGRMGHQEDALKLFLSQDEHEVDLLTNKLNEYNKIRQETEKNIYKEAIEKIENNSLKDNNVIIVGGENWHHGVIGIVSSKITEMYFKPSILLCYDGKFAKGSGRSIPGFDLYEALSKCDGILEKFGGHSMAIGIGLDRKNVDNLGIKLEKIAIDQEIGKIVPIIQVDSEILLDDINKELIENLKKLEPYGEANKMPIFVIKNLKIQSIRALSEGKHLKLTLTDNKNSINAIGFNMGEETNEYLIGDKIDVVGSIEINTFNGVDNIQINLKDMMRSI